MFKEIVEFVDKNIEEIERAINTKNTTSDKSKAIIIKVDQSSSNIFIDEISQYEIEKINPLNKPNKCLGGKQGLMTYVPYLFQVKYLLNETNEECKKCKKHIERVKEYYQDILNEDELRVLHTTLKLALSKENISNIKKIADTEKKINYVYISLPEHIKNKVDNVFKKYVSEKLFLKKDLKINNGRCMICGKSNTIVGVPTYYNSYDDSKIFLKHPTRHAHLPIAICEDCVYKLYLFEQFKKQYKLRIFPLFIDKELQKDEITILNTENNSSFESIMDKIYQRHLEYGESELCFYLCIWNERGNLVFLDYIPNYRWKIRWYKLSDKKEVHLLHVNRVYLEEHLKEIIGKKIYYFGSYPSSSTPKNRKEQSLNTMNAIIHWIYQYRNQLFNFIYRGENIYPGNLDQMVSGLIYIINSKLINKEVDEYSFILLLKNVIEIYYNKGNLEMGGEDNMSTLKSLRGLWEKLEEQTNISDEEWAYLAGAMYGYLLDQSKGEKHVDLTPFINCYTGDEVKRILGRLFEKYSYKIKTSYIKPLFSLVFGNNTGDFTKLKPYFYTGVCDYFLFGKDYFYNKIESGGDENE